MINTQASSADISIPGLQAGVLGRGTEVLGRRAGVLGRGTGALGRRAGALGRRAGVLGRQAGVQAHGQAHRRSGRPYAWGCKGRKYAWGCSGRKYAWGCKGRKYAWGCKGRKYASLQAFVFCLLVSCAQQGSLTGGLKDETPPRILKSVPENFTTHFNSSTITLTFDEYFSLKDISKQLVVSPPMAKKPDFKIKGKQLEIVFKDSLVPDRTYAINFGDAIVDLNEGNAIKNYQYVFSTGDKIDSLKASGRVLMVPDGKPAEDVLVMLYNGTADSLPLKTIPLYISRTDKDGRFTLKNLAEGSYKIFALKDANTNYLFDQPSEAVAFLDTLIKPYVVAAVAGDTLEKEEALRLPVDSVKQKTEDERRKKEEEDQNKYLIKKKVKKVDPKDSLALAKEAAKLPKKPKDHYYPDKLELHMFTEVKPNQYLSGSDRIRRDQIRLQFFERVDSIGFEFLNLPIDSVQVALEWLGDVDTLDLWLLNPALAKHDSLKAIVSYPKLDSIERRVVKSDTVKLRYRPAVQQAQPQVAKGTKGSKPKDFTVAVSVESSKTLEFGRPLVFTTSLPYTKMDTSLIRLVTGKDSVPKRVHYRIVPDTLKGLILNGLPIKQTHPRIFRLEAGLQADTTYRLIMLPGALIGLEGQKNDSLDIRFKMKSKDQYGTIKIALPVLKGPAIVELVSGGNKTVATRYLNGAGTAEFDLMAPGKYTARLTFDTNGNRRWDTGRYIKHIQPETVIVYPKEMNLKANWEVSETWQW